MKQSAMILGLALLAMPAMAQKSRPAEMLLESARQKETVEGDLKGALKVYEDVVKRHSGDRAAVAKALMGMAECHQKMGDSEALRLYQRVAGEYADQKEAAQQARVRMAQLRPRGENAVANRKVFTLPEGGDIFGTVSPDGRYVPYVHWRKFGNLFLRDLMTGLDRALTNTASDGPGVPSEEVQYAEEYCFSRDGKKLVYSWFRGDRDKYELRMISLEGSGVPTFRTLLEIEDISWIGPHDWSSDGKWIAVALHRKDKSAQIGLVSAQDGALRVLKSVDWRGPAGMYFSPDGKYIAYDLHPGDSELQRDVFVLAVDGSREIPAVVHSSNDVVLGWIGGRVVFSSDRSGTVDLWAVPIVSGKVEGGPVLVKREFGNGHGMGLTQSGTLYYSYFQAPGADVQTAMFDFEKGEFSTAPVQAVQSYVGRNQMPDWSPDGKFLAWSSRRGSPTIRYFVIGIRSIETGQTREILPTPNLSLFWSLRWAHDGKSFLVSGRDVKGRNGVFRVDAETGRCSMVMEDKRLPGTPVESTDGKYLYFARSSEDSPMVSLVQRTLADGMEKTLRSGKFQRGLGLSRDGRFLVANEIGEQQGPVAVVAVPTDGRAPRELFRVTGSHRAASIGWIPGDDAALVLKILVPGPKGQRELWRAPFDGGEPKKLADRFDPFGTGLNVHPDGRQVVFATPSPRTPIEVWALENFLPVKGGSN